MNPSAKPAILAIDDDPQVLRAIRQDLRVAYADKYRVLGGASASEGLAILDSLESQRASVALLLVDQRMPEKSGVEFLLEAASRFPDAKRVLITAYADTNAAIVAINKVRLDYYLLKPWDPPEERLYPVLNDLLADWDASHHPPYQGILVVGNLASPLTHTVRDFLTRNEHPFRFLDVDGSQEAARIAETYPERPLPLVVFPQGEALSAPTIIELAGRLGLTRNASRPHYDVVIVGAGPAGLAAGVYGASEGLSVLLVDSDVPGGQAGTSSHIDNYLGFPSGVTGADLARRAVTQARRFGVELLYPVEVVGLRRADPARIVTLADGSEVSAGIVLLAMGVTYNRLDVKGAKQFENAGLYYGATVTESSSCIAQQVFVVGGANSAGQAAIHFAKFARKVTMLVRADSLDEGMSRYLVDEIRRTGNIEIRLHTRIVEFCGTERLESILHIDDRTGVVQVERTRLVFTFIGALPRTEWLRGVVRRDQHGFILTGPDLAAEGESAAPWDLGRDPYFLETSVPGVFSVGDVRARSIKRVAAGVGEGAMAIALIHRYLMGEPAAIR
jgi:thioredoxin reductase (NADPH)